MPGMALFDIIPDPSSNARNGMVHAFPKSGFHALMPHFSIACVLTPVDSAPSAAASALNAKITTK
jgi:hypothetical protein